MRTLTRFGPERVKELEEAWRQKHDERERKRLQVIRLVEQHKLTAQQIAEAVGISRPSVFNYVRDFQEGGVKKLLETGYTQRPPRGRLDEDSAGQLREKLRKGEFKRAKEAQAWLAGRKVKLALKTVYYWLKKAGGVLKVPRKTHAKKDAARVELFRQNLSASLEKLAGGAAKVRVWVADEHRYGLLPVIRRCWGLKGVRVRAPWATCYKWGYLYEALEVDGANRSEFMFVPTVDKDISAAFLRQLGELEPDALHIVIWDNAGFHPREGEASVPQNVRLLRLPPLQSRTQSGREPW